LVPKVCLLQMKVGILIMFSTTFFLGNTWCLKYIDALFHLQSQLLNLRHSLTTRFLLTCISSYFFDGENTLDDLHEVMAADATFLYEKGITAPLKNDLLLIFIIWPLHFQGSLWACLTLNQTKKKTVHPVCFIACLHPRLVQSTCGSYAWERKEIGYSCAKMLVESSITLLLIHVNPTSYTLFPMTINTISKWGINWSVILFWMLPSGNLRHFTSIAGSIVFRNAISVMVSTGRTCHWKPHGGTRWDWGEAHPLFGAKKGASPCSKYQAWGKMRYCPIRAMFFT
jgi:hypothetical protein